MTAFSFTSGNPSNLTGGATASMTDISGSLTDVKTYINGKNIDVSNIANSTLGGYRTFHETEGWLGGGTATGTYLPNALSGDAFALAGTGIAATWKTVYLDSSDFTVTGLTPKLRIRLSLLVGTAPTSTFSAALYNVTGVLSNAGTVQVSSIGAALAGSTTSTLVAPTASTTPSTTGSDFVVPTAGAYILGLIVATSATAAAAAMNAKISLQMRYI